MAQQRFDEKTVREAPMYSLHRLTLVLGGMLLPILTSLMVCTTNPAGVDDEDLFITVSLIEYGNKTAKYLGSDIDLIIEFKDSVTVKLGTTFNIHSLNAQIVHTQEIITNMKVLSLVVPLYWESAARLPIDSSVMKPLDSIYVQAGLNKSNVVKVQVYNLPPKITSLRVGDSSFNVPSHITDVLNYRFFVSDTARSAITMAVSVVDPDQNYNISWGIYCPDNTPEIEKYLIYSGTTARYIPRRGNLRDIVSILINDGNKQIHIAISMLRSDHGPVILDSITVKNGADDTLFKDANVNTCRMNVIVLDSAALRAYPRKQGGTGAWTARNGLFTYNYGLDSGGCAVTYRCTLSSAGDTLVTDTVSFVDSIRFTYKNSMGTDSLVKTVVIYRVSPNRHPVIDSISINGKMRKANFRDTITADTTIPLIMFATDPEGGRVTFTWHGNLTGELSADAGDSNSYTAAETAHTDTIIVLAADSLGFLDTAVIILKVEEPLIIDNGGINTLFRKMNDALLHDQDEKDTIF